MSPSACDDCPVNAQLSKMGLRMDQFDAVVALAGNPNTGKSTLFNALTGLNQHTGNWPGKTVTRAEGGFSFSSVRYKLVDLPGTYSLLSASQDEDVARNFILFGKPDCVIVVTDATSLERNLNLVLQVTEITSKVVVAVNLMDEARRKGIEVDVRALSRDLGVPAIPVTARTGEGVQMLLSTLHDVVAGNIRTEPFRTKTSPQLQNAIDELAVSVEKLIPGIPNSRWIAIRLIDGDPNVEAALKDGSLKELVEQQQRQDLRLGSKTALSGNQ